MFHLAVNSNNKNDKQCLILFQMIEDVWLKNLIVLKVIFSMHIEYMNIYYSWSLMITSDIRIICKLTEI